MKIQFPRTSYSAALVLALCAFGASATTPPPATPSAPAARPNPHKSYDKRFNACKAEARNAGTTPEAYQAFIQECMKRS